MTICEKSRVVHHAHIKNKIFHSITHISSNVCYIYIAIALYCNYYILPIFWNALTFFENRQWYKQKTRKNFFNVKNNLYISMNAMLTQTNTHNCTISTYSYAVAIDHFVNFILQRELNYYYYYSIFYRPSICPLITLILINLKSNIFLIMLQLKKNSRIISLNIWQNV